MTDTHEFEQMEKDGWSNPKIAQGYAEGFATASQQIALALASTVAAKSGTRALDLCTGHGVVAAALIARGAEATGLDFSEAMIALARKAVPRAAFMQGDAMDLTFPDSQFDAVTIGFGVPHFPDTAKGLAEAVRVLKPGGRLAFSIWKGQGSDGSFGWLFDAVERIGDKSVTLPPGPDAHALADPDAAQDMVSQVGLVDFKLTEFATHLWIAAADDLFDVFDQGAVRAASLLSGQPQQLRQAIRDDLAKQVGAHGTPHANGFLVAAPSVVVTARKPAP